MDKYAKLVQQGATPEQLVKAVRNDELPLSQQLDTVKRTLKLSVVETKRLFASVDNTSLDAQQEQAAQDIETLADKQQESDQA